MSMIKKEEQRITAAISEVSRMRVHLGTAISICKQPYLQLPREMALYVASLRSYTHFLNVERMRRLRGNTPFGERCCPLCTDVVEDEKHAFLDCSDHADSRVRFVAKYNAIKGSGSWSRLPIAKQMN